MPRIGLGQVAGLGEIADIFGVSQATVKVWVKKGLKPLKQGAKGVSWEFRTSEVHRWLMENEAPKRTQESSIKDLQLRKLEAETLKAELELAKSKSEVAPIEDIQRLLAHTFIDIKSRLHTIPNRAAIKVVGLSDESEIKRVLLDEIDQSLERLADADSWNLDSIEVSE